MIWLYILVALAVLAFVGAVIWLLTYIFREQPEEGDSTILVNFMANKTNGRFLGVVRNVVPSRNGRVRIEYDARDLDLNRLRKTKEDTTAVITVPQNNIISVTKGKQSKDRNIDIIPPYNPEDLDPSLKNSPFGIGMMFAAKLKSYENVVEQILREGTDRRDELLKKIGDGEISKELMKYFEGYIKDFMESTVNLKSKDKPTGLPSGTAGQYGN